jgi:hypothetical protein
MILFILINFHNIYFVLQCKYVILYIINNITYLHYNNYIAIKRIYVNIFINNI